MATLEQMADKISESHFFANDAASDEPVSTEPESLAATAPEPVVTETQTPPVAATEHQPSETKSQSTSVFKKLTGFWN